MPLTPKEIRTVSELAAAVYDFLPGKPHPYADPRISFGGVADAVGLRGMWPSGSKQTAIAQLLRDTLELRRDRFCSLVVELVNRALVYRESKARPITRAEILRINEAVKEVGFKIPELWDPTFLDSLGGEPSSQAHDRAPTLTADMPTAEAMAELNRSYESLLLQEANPRGFAFERFLNSMLQVFNLSPRAPFRLVGEQIDGSFALDNEIYLVEARWQDGPSGQRELRAFSKLVEDKAQWSRGLFISYAGFSHDGLTAFQRGGKTNIIGIDGQDIYFILRGEITLTDAIRAKVRHAAETGDFYFSVFDICRRLTSADS